jgi:hypothetical protein
MRVPRFEVFPEVEDALLGDDPVYDKVPTGQFCWHFKDANGHITFTAGESFTRREDAHRSIRGTCADVLVAVLGNLPQVASARVALREDNAGLPIIDLDENEDVISGG